MLTNIKRWLLFVVTGVGLVLLLAIAASFVVTHRVRSQAAGYLDVVRELRIGTTYDIAVAQLHNAKTPMTLLGECSRECSLVFRFEDKLLYALHLAPPTGFIGRLRFQDGRLVSKLTVMGRDTCCMAAVQESASEISKTLPRTVDSAGHPWKIIVGLSAADFTGYRNQAYAFNVACIGSMKGCRTDEYLPTAHDLERASKGR